MCNTMHMDNTIETTSNEEVKTDEIVQPIEPEFVVEEPKSTGRPSGYTQEIADKICERIAEGASMRTVCTPDDMPGLATVFRWLREHSIFRDQYARATEERTEAMSEEILDIADDGSNDFMVIQKGTQSYQIENKEVTNRSRLRVDTRKWLMSKMKPKKYGEKLDMTTNGKDLPTPIYNGSATESRT